MRDIVIDLGSTEHMVSPDADAAPSPSVWTRPILGLLVAVLLVAGLVQSSPPVASMLKPLGQIELGFAADSGIMFAHGGIVSFHPDHGIASHRLDGTLRWEMPRRVVSFLQVHPDIIFYEMFLSGPLSQETMHLEARDPATGDLLWRLPGGYGGHTDTLLFVADDGSDGTATLRVHDIHTGELRWSTPHLLSHYVEPDFAAPDLAGPDLAEAADPTVAGLTATHEFVEYAQATGRVLRTAALELPAGESYLLYLEEDHVEIIVGRTEDANWTESVHQFDRESLDPLRRPESGVANEPHWLDAAPCGELTCVYEMQDDTFTTRIMDRTGTTIRTLESDRWLWETAAGLLVVHNEITEELLDASTGLPLAHHAGWRTLPGGLGDTLLLGDPRGNSQVYLAMLDATGLRTLGKIPGPISNCTHEAVYLACQTTDNRIRIWEITEVPSTQD